MYDKFQKHLQKELADIEAAGLYKNERIIESPQGAEILVKGKKCLNFCANNYLGLADNPELIKAAKDAMDARGFGMASVRLSAAVRICTNSWKRKSPISSVLRTLSSTLLASTPTAVFSNPCSPKRTLSSATR